MHVRVVVVVPEPQVTVHCDVPPCWQLYVTHGGLVHGVVADTHDDWQPRTASGLPAKLRIGDDTPFRLRMHVLVVVVVPVPQVTEQAEGCPRWQEYAAQGCMVHEALVDWQPLQATAACGMLCQLGTGMIWPFSDLTHWLVVVVMPLPHVTEHCEGCPRWQE